MKGDTEQGCRHVLLPNSALLNHQLPNASALTGLLQRPFLLGATEDQCQRASRTQELLPRERQHSAGWLTTMVSRRIRAPRWASEIIGRTELALGKTQCYSPGHTHSGQFSSRPGIGFLHTFSTPKINTFSISLKHLRHIVTMAFRVWSCAMGPLLSKLWETWTQATWS